MDTVIRVVFVYLLLMLLFRVMGKRELSQLSPFELVTLLLIPEIFSQALQGEDYSMTNAVTGGTTLLGVVYLTSIVTHRFRRVEQIVGGQPTVLVYDGGFIDDHMNRERVQPSEVFAAMHSSGLDRLSQVKWAILQSDGRIAVVPAAPADKQVKQRQEGVVG